MPSSMTTLSLGTMTAVKHANGQDYWLLTPHDSSDIYFALHVSADSLEEVVEQQFPAVARRNHNGVVAKFSPDGETYIGYESTYLEQALKVFSFDRQTGQLTLDYTLPHPEEETSVVGGIEFSASGRYLYVSTRFTIYQYDLEAADVAGSKTIVAEWEEFYDPFPCTFHVMQRGPDCRIYINTSNSQQWLHVIMYPDNAGPACEVRQHEIPLYYYHQISMPYFPNYRLGTGEPVCDSSLGLPTAIPIVPAPALSLRVTPNPASGRCRAWLSPELAREGVSLQVVDLMGRVLRQEDLRSWARTEIDLDLGGLPAGLYLVQVATRDGNRVTARLVVSAYRGGE